MIYILILQQLSDHLIIFLIGKIGGGGWWGSKPIAKALQEELELQEYPLNPSYLINFILNNLQLLIIKDAY